MKTKRNYLFFLFAIAIIAINGCNDDDCEKSEKSIPLDYSKCPCDHEANFFNTIQKDNVLMFDASKTNIEQMEKLSLNNDGSYIFIYINKEHNIASVRFMDSPFQGTINICNFPAYLKEMNIPSNGIMVSFSGDKFEKCEPIIFPETIMDSDLVLTSLKIFL